MICIDKEAQTVQMLTKLAIGIQQSVSEHDTGKLSPFNYEHNFKKFQPEAER